MTTINQATVAEDLVPGPGATQPNYDRLKSASVVIWTTTPWTLPGNRAISFSPKISYGLYRVTEAPADNWAKTGDLLILADKLARDVLARPRAELRRFSDATPDMLASMTSAH